MYKLNKTLFMEKVFVENFYNSIFIFVNVIHIEIP